MGWGCLKASAGLPGLCSSPLSLGLSSPLPLQAKGPSWVDGALLAMGWGWVGGRTSTRRQHALRFCRMRYGHGWTSTFYSREMGTSEGHSSVAKLRVFCTCKISGSVLCTSIQRFSSVRSQSLIPWRFAAPSRGNPGLGWTNGLSVALEEAQRSMLGMKKAFGLVPDIPY